MPFVSLLAICFLLCCAVDAGATDPPDGSSAVWSGVVFASNDPHPAQPPPRLRPFANKLRHIFGYNQYELVGESAQRIDPSERWLMPSKDFSLTVRRLNAPGQRSPARIVLFENRRRLAEFEARLKPGSPLFIRGPLYASGQLVIVLCAAEPSEVPAPRPAVNPGKITIIPVAKLHPGPAPIVPIAKSKAHPGPQTILTVPSVPAPGVKPAPGDPDSIHP
ncbi:MAG: hypothetical protein ABSE62_10965 [Chthoniobacteraceae bacterium]|jgi:hypothetical protein